jgi:hypothetical protein
MSATKFTVDMVQKTIKYFGDPKSVDEKDPAAMKEFIGQFVKFEQVIAKGQIDSNAKKLALEFLVFAQDWIKKNKLEKMYNDLRNE